MVGMAVQRSVAINPASLFALEIYFEWRYSFAKESLLVPELSPGVS
jgi:hypothetical protein